MSSPMKVDYSKINDVEVKIVVSKAFGNAEQVNAEATCKIELADVVTDALAEKILTRRALSYTQETVDMQLIADQMAREIEARDKAEQDKLKNKGGK